MSAAALGRIAVEVFGEDRVSVVPDLAEAIERGTTLAEAGEAIEVSIGAGAVLVTGSVVTVGEARAMLKGRR
jgi:dihydrofolate synthase/folylpolyglutamate synthase